MPAPVAIDGAVSPQVFLIAIGLAAFSAAASSLVASHRAVGCPRSSTPRVPLSASGASMSAVSLFGVVLSPGHKRGSTRFAWFRGAISASVTCAVRPVGVASPARRHDVLGSVVVGVSVQVVGAESGTPDEAIAAPVARHVSAVDRFPENQSADPDLAVLGCERMTREIASKVCTFHTGHYSIGRIQHSGHFDKVHARTMADQQQTLL